MDDDRKDYWDDVTSIAAEVVALDEDDRHDRVHEDVDGSMWVIYTHRNLKVIGYSGTDPSETEWQEFLPERADWSQTTAIVAFCCMEADVWEAVHRLESEAAKTAA